MSLPSDLQDAVAVLVELMHKHEITDLDLNLYQPEAKEGDADREITVHKCEIQLQHKDRKWDIGKAGLSAAEIGVTFRDKVLGTIKAKQITRTTSKRRSMMQKRTSRKPRPRSTACVS